MLLEEIYCRFQLEADCISLLEQLRWNGKPKCPYCHSLNATPRPNENRHHCNICYCSFSVSVGTVFHHTRIPIQKWFAAILFILDHQEVVSVRDLSYRVQVNRNTAHRIIQKIKKGMVDQNQRLLLDALVSALVKDP